MAPPLSDEIFPDFALETDRVAADVAAAIGLDGFDLQTTRFYGFPGVSLEAGGPANAEEIERHEIGAIGLLCQRLAVLADMLTAAGHSIATPRCTTSAGSASLYALFGSHPSGIPYTIFADSRYGDDSTIRIFFGVDYEGNYVVNPTGCGEGRCI